jgi:hypothetical protein
MTEKIGPYGSHYGQGCYTKSCSLRHAAEAGISRPVSYDTTNQAYNEAHANYMTANSSVDIKLRRAKLKEATVRRNATPEGLKELKKKLPQTKLLFGDNSTVSILKEEEIQNAQNFHDQQDSAFKLNVFKANPRIEPKDFRAIAEYSSRYSFDKKQGILIDTKDGSVFARLDKNGELQALSGDSMNLASPDKLEEYVSVKDLITTRIAEDVLTSILLRPTINSKIANILNTSYEVDKPKVNISGSSTVIIRDKISSSPLARFHYDSHSAFDQAEWSSPRNDGSLVWPEKSSAVILNMLEQDTLTKMPPLPSWIN